MRLHDLKPAAGSHRDKKRLGRGNATGQGTTAGKGTKGEKARSGGLKAGFRGMSSRNFRLAKRRGFTNRFGVTYQPVNVSDLAAFEAGAKIDVAVLKAAGLVRGRDPHVKILGDGEIAIALVIDGIKTSAQARRKIEGAGGSIQGIEVAEPKKKIKAPAAVAGPPEIVAAATAPKAEAAPIQTVSANATDEQVPAPIESKRADEPAPAKAEGAPRPRRRKVAAEPEPAQSRAEPEPAQSSAELESAQSGEEQPEKPKRTRKPRTSEVKE
jgi:large subunit ribosomal protein L15